MSADVRDPPVEAEAHYLRRSFGRQVASRRVLRGWTQAELGERVGCEQATVSRWESGDREPSLQGLVLLAQSFCCAVDDLLGLIDEEAS